MRLISIETTPNPNSMKLNLDESVGNTVTYTSAERLGCPEQVSGLLDIEGVKSVFVCNNFMTVNRDPRADWKQILDSVTNVFGGEGAAGQVAEKQRHAAEKLGQVSVLVQTFRGIPIQVKVTDGEAEQRIALNARFNEAAQLVQSESGADYLKDRYWADRGVRYGSLAEIVAEVAEEIEGTIDSENLERLVAQALGRTAEAEVRRSIEGLQADLASGEWHRRLQAVQELGSTEEALPLLIKSLDDENHQVRRMAAAALGASGNEAAVVPLSEVLRSDPSVGVRRTAGDALSDLGSVLAQPAACRALSDSNKLVRWRAARFLADVGTEEALPFLHDAVADREFEVRLEVEAAIERISGGKEGSMPVWKKILKDSDLAH